MSLTFDNEVLKEKDYVIGVRQWLHAHPELSMQEYRTAEFIRNELDKMEIPYQVIEHTGTFAKLEGTGPVTDGCKKKSVMLRADIDALPMEEITGLPYASQNLGVMHSCGHDVHTGALLGAAKVLSGMRERFSGTIYFAFQQAEEKNHGSQFFLKAGVTKGIDRILGFHIAPEYPCGTVAMTNGVDAASCDYFKITVEGTSAHIAKPHLGHDALAAIVEISSRISKIKSEYLNPFECAVVGIGRMEAGSSYNVIAKEAYLEGSVRALSTEAQELILGKICEIADAAAKEHGCSAKVEIENFTAVLKNDPEVFEEVYKTAAEFLGEEHVLTDQGVIMGFTADDFSQYMSDIKGTYIHLGTHFEDENSKRPLHSNNLVVDENAVVIGTQLHVRYVRAFLGF